MLLIFEIAFLVPRVESIGARGDGVSGGGGWEPEAG